MKQYHLSLKSNKTNAISFRLLIQSSLVNVLWHSTLLYFYCSSILYYRLLLKSYIYIYIYSVFSSTIRSILISTSFSYRTTSSATAHVLCAQTPSSYRHCLLSSLHSLVHQGYPVRERASFRPFCRSHHSAAQFLISDRLLSTHTLYCMSRFLHVTEEVGVLRYRFYYSTLPFISHLLCFLPFR